MGSLMLVVVPVGVIDRLRKWEDAARACLHVVVVVVGVMDQLRK